MVERGKWIEHGWSTIGERDTWEAMSVDSSFIRRGQELIIPQEEYTLVSIWWYVFGWGKNIGRHFICILMGKKRQGKELYKVIGGPALDDSVVRETTKLQSL